MQAIKAIETQYKGYRFRSRLEARWAVFFEAVGLAFEYEKEGFDLADVGYYLPDFYLPTLDTWVEVKPGGAEDDSTVCSKCHCLAVGVQKPVLLIAGNPGHDGSGVGLDYRLRLFGGMPWDIFESLEDGRDNDPFEQGWPSGSWLFDELREFLLQKIEEGRYLSEADAAEYIIFALDERERRKAMIELDRLYYRRKYGKEHPHRQMRVTDASWYFALGVCQIQASGVGTEYQRLPWQLQDALAEARSARFEGD